MEKTLEKPEKGCIDAEHIPPFELRACGKYAMVKSQRVRLEKGAPPVFGKKCAAIHGSVLLWRKSQWACLEKDMPPVFGKELRDV
jgi:hypothetical protein